MTQAEQRGHADEKGKRGGEIELPRQVTHLRPFRLCRIASGLWRWFFLDMRMVSILRAMATTDMAIVAQLSALI